MDADDIYDLTPLDFLTLSVSSGIRRRMTGLVTDVFETKLVLSVSASTVESHEAALGTHTLRIALSTTYADGS